MRYRCCLRGGGVPCWARDLRIVDSFMLPMSHRACLDDLCNNATPTRISGRSIRG
jgi:hypothetical protein